MKLWVCNHTMEVRACAILPVLWGKRLRGWNPRAPSPRRLRSLLKAKRVRNVFLFLFCSLACFRLKKTNQNLWKEWWDASVPAGPAWPQKAKWKHRSSNPWSVKFNGTRGQGRPPSWPLCSAGIFLTSRSAITSPTTPASLEDALYF